MVGKSTWQDAEYKALGANRLSNSCRIFKMTVTTIVNGVESVVGDADFGSQSSLASSYAVKAPLVNVPTTRSDHGTEYEALGKNLMEAMSAYVGHLRNEKLPLPSLDPGVVDSPPVKHADGVASKEKIIELAQEICARTMDPKMNLLISSLQVLTYPLSSRDAADRIVSLLLMSANGSPSPCSRSYPQEWSCGG